MAYELTILKDQGTDSDFLKKYWNSSVEEISSQLKRGEEELEFSKKLARIRGITRCLYKRDVLIIKDRVKWLSNILKSKRKDPNYIPDHYKINEISYKDFYKDILLESSKSPKFKVGDVINSSASGPQQVSVIRLGSKPSDKPENFHSEEDEYEREPIYTLYYMLVDLGGKKKHSFAFYPVEDIDKDHYLFGSDMFNKYEEIRFKTYGEKYKKEIEDELHKLGKSI